MKIKIIKVDKVVFILCILMFFVYFVRGVEPLPKAKYTYLVTNRSNIVTVIPKGKVYQVTPGYKYEVINIEGNRINTNLDKELIYQLLKEESFEQYRLISKFAEVVEEINKNEFPVIYTIEDESVVINTKATRESEQYKLFFNLKPYEHIIIEIKECLGQSSSVEDFLTYLDYKGIKVENNTIIIEDIEMEYDFVNKTLKKVG
jgi:hypothetical protein